MPHPTQLLALVALLATPAFARADGLHLDFTGARAVGRAGAVTVSEDGGAALALNPAGMARREQWRAQVGLALLDRGLTYLASGTDGGTADPGQFPLVENRAPVTRIPQVSVQGPLGPVVVGLAYLETGALAIELPEPFFDQLASEVVRLYPHRYGGTRLRHSSRSLSIGASVRAASWLGLGLTLAAARVAMVEERHMWAGFAGRDALFDPARDVALSLSGTDWFVPRVVAGALLAPPDVPLEMALSVSYTAGAELLGRPRVSATRQAEFSALTSEAAESQIALGGRLLVRSGVRYLGRRFSVEFAGELEIVGSQSPTWAVSGVTVRDDSSAVGELTQVPALAVERSRGGLRAAADFELVPGFLWLTGGYALTAAGSPRVSASPVFANLGGHTLAVGVEGQWNGLAVSLGYARTMASELTVETGQLAVVNPFAAGGGLAGLGRYSTDRDVLSVTFEAAWP